MCVCVCVCVINDDLLIVPDKTHAKDKSLYIAIGTVGAILLLVVVILVVLLVLWKRGKLKPQRYHAYSSDTSTVQGYDPSFMGRTTGLA